MGAYEFMRVKGTVAPGGSANFNPGGGSGQYIDDAQVQFTNTSNSTPLAATGTVTVTQYGSDVHQHQHVYKVLGTTLMVEITGLNNGQFFAQIIVPFSEADLKGSQWSSHDLMYWNPSGGGAWELAVKGNDQPSPNGPQGNPPDPKLGIRYPVENSVIPTLRTCK